MCVCVCVCVCALSRAQFFATPWSIAHQASLSVEFSRQEYCSGLPFPSPGMFPPQRLNPLLLDLLHWQADYLPLHQWEAPILYTLPQF